jgi:hypothetical protein
MTEQRPMMVGAATVFSPPEIGLSLRTRHSAIAPPMTAAAQGNRLARRSCFRHQENAK